jgi:trans-aconitate methyltransferase
VTGLDLATASVERLRQRFPQARFELADASEWTPDADYDVVNAFDVLYHITDDARWERAVRNLAGAVAPGGWLVLTDVFEAGGSEAVHNVTRPWAAYRSLLQGLGLALGPLTPTHVLLNRPLGPLRFLNRVPGLLYVVDRALLAVGFSWSRRTNRILVAQRRAGRAS